MKKATRLLSKAVALLIVTLLVVSTFSTLGVFASPDEQFNVTWYNGTQKVKEDIVNDGETASFDTVVNGIPQKAADDEYAYTFIGWNTDPDAETALALSTSADGKTYYSEEVHNDTDYYAVFDKTPLKNIKYTVEWINGDTVMHTDKIKKGGKALYSTVLCGTPEKASDDEITYKFVGWNTDPDATEALPLVTNVAKTHYYSAAVTADIKYYAIFKSSIQDTNKPLHTVLWKNGDKVVHKDVKEIKDGTNAIYSVLMFGKPKKASDELYDYKFIGWNTDPDATEALDLKYVNGIYYSGPIYEDTDMYAIFEAIPKAATHMVTWMNGDEEIYTERVRNDVAAEYNKLIYGTPAKEETDRYIYNFIGWSTDPDATAAETIVATDEDVVYYAVFEAVDKNNTCVVTWKNGDEVLFEQKIKKGSRSSYNTVLNGVPYKPADDDYTYEFIGWNTDPDAEQAIELIFTGVSYKSDKVSENTTYYAIFKATEKDDSDRKVFTVLWKNGDVVLHHDTNEIYKGTNAIYPVALFGIPEKAEDEEYTYEFIGWNTDPDATEALDLKYAAGIYYSGPIYEDTVLYAIFKAVPKDPVEPVVEYTVNWKNGDEIIFTQQVEEGDTSIYNKLINGTPKKASDDEYDYTFIGWNTDPDATEALPLYESSSRFVSDAVYGNIDYYAIFKAEEKEPVVNPFKKYTVLWKNGDKLIHHDYKEIKEGTRAIYMVSVFGIPEKAEDDDYTYEFIGWNTDPDATEALDLELKNNIYYSELIYEDTTYYAIFKAVPKDPVNPITKYTVTWMVNGNAHSGQYDLGDIPTYDTAVEMPAKASTAQYDYEFIGWNTVENSDTALDFDVENGVYSAPAVTGDAVYYPVFKANVRSYTVTWVVDGKTTEEVYEYGAMPEFKGSTDKASDDKYYYRFIGWDKQIVAVEADATYTAVYEQKEITSPKTGDTAGILWMVLGAVSLIGGAALTVFKKKMCIVK